jgi:osmotically-inducible protein OsmY
MGAAVAYFFDPDRGRGRRAKIRDRSFAMVRRGGTRVGRAARFTGAYAYGVGQKIRHLRSNYEPPNDAALVDKVKTELFREHPEFKHISINVAEGVVWLRGEVQHPEDMQRLEKTARRIQGVTGIENLLHLVNTPAPNIPG